MLDYAAEERMTDDIVDAQALEVIKREAAKIEAMLNEPQPITDRSAVATEAAIAESA